ncbi:MAG TPA: hypothetical protein VNK04_05825 [Gemmataceae bacterium]|nr:hypothetical protein [Gemmataceae bacterium]
MGAPRLQHDHAWAAAAAILDLVKHRMREECRRDAHTAFYDAILACLQHYEQDMQREAARLCRPSRN